MNILVFDIETVPDVELGRRLYDLDGLADAEVGKAMFRRSARQERAASSCRTSSIASSRFPVCSARARASEVWSLGEPERRRTRAGRSASSTASSDSRPTSFPGTAAASTCRCCTTVRCEPGAGAALLGDRRRGHRVPLQQLPGPLSLAPHGCHGRAVRLPAARAGLACRTWPGCSVCRASWASPAQVWDALLAGEIARIRRYCETDVHQYLARLPALRADARPAHARALRRRGGARSSSWLTEASSRTSPSSCAYGSSASERARARTRRATPPRPKPAWSPRSRTKAKAWCAAQAARPRSSRARCPASASASAARSAIDSTTKPARRSARASPRSRDAALRALWRVRRLRAAAPRARSAARREAEGAARQPRAHRAA